jgi:hypothetical protein
MVNWDNIEKYAKKIDDFLAEMKNNHVKLEDIDLIKRVDKKGSVKEIRSIYALSVYCGRNIVELPIPGSIGNIFQDMGRSPLVVIFEGFLLGPDAVDTLKDIKGRFELQRPVRFSSDVAVISEIQMVIIEKFTVHFEGGVNSGVRYSMVLKEFLSNSTTKGKTEKEPPSLASKAVAVVAGKITKVALDKLTV